MANKRKPASQKLAKKPTKEYFKKVPTHINLKVTFELGTNINGYAAKRGMSTEALLTMMLRSFDKSKVTLTPGSKMTFGKYRDILVDTVIRGDPRYMAWVRDNVEHVILNNDCLDLISSFEDD